jgi:hypothetical protein
MMRSCRRILVASLLASFTCGCANFWHDLQPHRLHRLNRGAAPALSPDFTQSVRPATNRLVRLDHSGDRTEVSANCAEVILARGQNPGD